ncbi:MAG: (d)CMP kinase [Thermomicrobiales bacterium]
MSTLSPSTLPVIAIDGPAAAGKSTVAKGVADELGIRSFDTGLLYRAAALVAIDRAIAPSDGPALAAAIDHSFLDLNRAGEMLLDGVNVSSRLRSPEVESIVSEVAAHSAVRRSLFRVQRRIAESAPVVMVGRDITTVVVPDAAVRIYLDASVEERARRRLIDKRMSDESATYSTILAELRERDRRDSSRENAPLFAAEGVTVINSDELTPLEVIELIAGLARQAMPSLSGHRKGARAT